MARNLPLAAGLAGWLLIVWPVAELVSPWLWAAGCGIPLVAYGAVAVWAQVKEERRASDHSPS